MNRHRTHAFAALLGLGAIAAPPFLPVLAAQPADTISRISEPLFTQRDLLVAGLFVAGTVAAFPLDRRLAIRLQRGDAQGVGAFREAARTFNAIARPGALYIGGSLYVVGRVGRWSRIADLGLHGTEALVLGSTTASVLKGVIGRARPLVDVRDPRSFQLGRGFESDEFRAFPSNHSVSAFAAAAAVTSETHRWWPKSTVYVAPAMYGGAAMVGLSRMYENKHWLSDVVIGAAIGTFSGLKVVRYHHTHPNNRVDRWLLGATTVVPLNDGGAAVLVSLPTP